MTPIGWLDRAIGLVAPQLQLRRVRARLVMELALRHYEGAATGRRTQGWHRASTDANLANWTSLAKLRDAARDLVRNNGHAESALTTIGDHAVGAGIVAKPFPDNARTLDLWRAWAETPACDADGRLDFYGLQKLVMRGVAESGEVLIRRRLRRPEDGLPIPLQVQVLESDYLDTQRTMPLPNGGQIIQGIEFDAIGARVAYWLFPSHPGSSTTTTATLFAQSRRIPASEILHVFKAQRPGQVRAVSWFAPVLLRFKDFDEFEDATLMKQKIAACLAVITSDIDGGAGAIGTPDDAASPMTDTLEPGAILNLPPGRSVNVVQPPPVTDYAGYSAVSLRAIAAGLGVTYEDLTGDYTGMPFSAARMSRLRHWARVDDWRWRVLIPQFCDPVWGWATQAMYLTGLGAAPSARWTPPPMPMLDPSTEGLAYQRNIRTGIQTLSGAIRERGLDPDEVLAEMAADNAKLDALGLVLDSDARKITQHGLMQPSVPENPAGDAPKA
jgi:phage portal protein, lambda family